MYIATRYLEVSRTEPDNLLSGISSSHLEGLRRIKVYLFSVWEPAYQNLIATSRMNLAPREREFKVLKDELESALLKLNVEGAFDERARNVKDGFEYWLNHVNRAVKSWDTVRPSWEGENKTMANPGRSPFETSEEALPMA